MSHRPVLILAAGCLLALALGACTAHGPTEVPAAAPAAPTATTPSPIPTTTLHEHSPKHSPKQSPRQPETPAPTPPVPPRALHFSTPQAAMRYLAAAYNRNDLTALKHVTNPVARTSLNSMRPMADNLRLVGCKANPGRGDYLCAFTHDYPATAHLTGHGQAHFTAAPADKVGWYMTVLNDCS